MTTRFAVLFLFLTGAVQSQEAEKQPFEFKVAPGPDYYFFVRDLAGPDQEVPDAYTEAVAECRVLGDLLAKPESWSIIDGAFSPVDAPGQYAQSMAQKFLPPKAHLKEGVKRIKAGNSALRLAQALDQNAADWVAAEWPEREKSLLTVRGSLEELLPREVRLQMLETLKETQGIARGDWAVPIRLVSSMPESRGVALLERTGSMACIVGVRGQSGTELAEGAFLQVMYALQAQPFYPPSMYETMAERLRHAGVEPETIQKAQSTIMHVCAASIIRLHLDPSHKDLMYNTQSYKESPELYDAAATLWGEYLQGELTRPELVTIIAELLGAQ